mmetsp:Transcript_51974/g.92757  ORF Transcript_51974/g.92757 Transcript_51974/m.92757 type:complete len:103 (+) Transcript_51974:248-556(+)
METDVAASTPSNWSHFAKAVFLHAPSHFLFGVDWRPSTGRWQCGHMTLRENHLHHLRVADFGEIRSLQVGLRNVDAQKASCRIQQAHAIVCAQLGGAVQLST